MIKSCININHFKCRRESIENASYQNLAQKAEIKLIFRNVWILEQSGMSRWRSKTGVVDEEAGFTGKSLQSLSFCSATDWFLQLLNWLTANCLTDYLLTNVLTVHFSNAIKWDAYRDWQELTADILTETEAARGPGGLEDGRWRRGSTDDEESAAAETGTNFHLLLKLKRCVRSPPRGLNL